MYSEPRCSCTRLDHGVLTVGCGVHELSKDYWIVKNRYIQVYCFYNSDITAFFIVGEPNGACMVTSGCQETRTTNVVLPPQLVT